MAEPHLKSVDLTAKAPDRDPDLNLAQRMLLVMERIGFIPKEGVGPASQGGYAFARVEHIKDKVRDELVRVGVMVYTSFDRIDVEVIGGDKRAIKAVVQGSMTFVNVDAPEDVQMSLIAGMALDNSDKAIAKAMTSADKYGLLNAFQIPTGNDPDETGVEVPSGSTGRPQTVARSEVVSSDDYQPSGAPERSGTPNDPDGKCPKHNRAWKAGQYGYYCSAKDDSTDRGYCVLKPSAEWAAAHER